MKTLLVLFMFAGVGWAAESNIYISSANIKTSTFTVKQTLVFGDSYEHVTVLRIDKDGDIFLRGKWIGYDWRLARILKSNDSTSFSFDVPKDLKK